MEMRPFEYVIQDQCVRVQFHQIARNTWQYRLRQILDCEQQSCAWNELIDIMIDFDVDHHGQMVHYIRGVKHTWDDLNFHTTSPSKIPPNKNFRKYQELCKDYLLEELLAGETPSQSRPYVEDLEPETCMNVIRMLLLAFEEHKGEKMTVPIVVSR